MTHIPSLSAPASATSAHSILAAARLLEQRLRQGHPCDAAALRHAMTEAYGQSDTDGAWVWKDAYEACEVATLLFLRAFLPAMRGSTSDTRQLLAMMQRLTQLLPTHTRRSEQSQKLQQFSTPLAYALLAADAARITSSDFVLEPSAGTGQLALHAELAGAALHLNEIGDVRATLLEELFPVAAVTRHNAEHLDDFLDPQVRPSVVLMNPPFSSSLHVERSMSGVDARHVRTALRRLAPGGRLVAITSRSFSPHNPDARQFFVELAEVATLRLSVPVAGSLFADHGTATATCLSVFDKTPGAANRDACPQADADTWADLAALLERHLPARLPHAVLLPPRPRPTPRPQPALAPVRVISESPVVAAGQPLAYEIITDPVTADSGQEGLYEPYAPERVRFTPATPHPTTLVQSAAMASVLAPVPTYRPCLPAGFMEQGLLSDAQLESVIYAGEAHSKYLAGHWRVDDGGDSVSAVRADDGAAVRFRRGWFLGDGTGAGKGRQVAGILLDNWLQGRRRALWVSKSDKLLEDAQRDWSALGQEKLRLVPQSRYRQGKPITLGEGILFTTYATLRSAEREGKASRVQQILDWLGADFDGVIIFDEAHAMGNAAPTLGLRGPTKGSQQGIAGLRLQYALPDARVVYVSATGATTVENLAYAQRLGLWGSEDLPFESRADFVAAMLEGGIAANEVLARDLKALGLYTARSLSYAGVEVEILDHALTPAQIAIYDAYAHAYQIIHGHLDAALKASNVTGTEGGTYNAAAKAAARSAFESSKQRFFGHLITAMKVPSLLRAIAEDLAQGHAAVIQLVSTSEALMERRLADIPPSEWTDLQVDVTPREYVLDYLKHSFPTQLYVLETDEDGHTISRPAYVDGNPVVCREAEARRDALLEQLGALPPVQAALDQIIHHFGTDAVAEVTGRSRRIVKKSTPRGEVLAVETRPASANIAETKAFMDDRKRILVFSDAGGTGRSYHADLAALNQRLRVHYLLEAGWKADAAIQGLGRTNRTNQKQPPFFRPVASDVRGEKRFISTIARRLDSLGAITRGQRQTGGQGLFRASDNLESPYAHAALRNFYQLLYAGKVPCCSLLHFEDATGLSLTDGDGTLREDLPPIPTFLNRLLALPIALQNALFEVFEGLLQAKVDAAMAAGTFEVGLETIRADSLCVTDRRTIAQHPSGATTALVMVRQKVRNQTVSVDSLRERAQRESGTFLLNGKSRRAALMLPAASWTLDDGTVEARVRLVRPLETLTHRRADMAETSWAPCDWDTFTAAWNAEVASLPEFSEQTLPLITGLLLPLWKSLPADNPRVFRLRTDAGEMLVGRLVPHAYLPSLAPDVTLDVTPEQGWQDLAQGRSYALGSGLSVKPVMVMHARRYELIGFAAEALPRLKALGCFAEIIAWKTRLFIPTGGEGLAVLTRLQQRYPLRLT